MSEVSDRSGYYMIWEQSVNTRQLSHPTILFDFSLLVASLLITSILFKNKHIDELDINYLLSCG